MLNSFAESFIQRVCGRYLKNFSSKNVEISVTGSILLTDIHVATDELTNFNLPFIAKKIFIGKLQLDIPILPGGNFNIFLSDLLVIATRRQDSPHEDPTLVHRALQMWISAVYFSLAASYSSKKTVVDVEYALSMLDRLVINISNAHFRLEENFQSHIPSFSGSDHYAFGVLVNKFQVKTPSKSEIQASSVWKKSNSKHNIVANKLIQCNGWSVYCSRSDPLADIDDTKLTIQFVRSLHFHRENCIISPFDISIRLCASYHVLHQVFSPVEVDIEFSSFMVSVNDEQISFLRSWIQVFHDHVLQQQRYSRLLHCSQCEEPSRRARMRWKVIRDMILKRDFYRFVGEKLTKGSVRWRIWFEQWRLAARYIAIRGLLMYHVGYEAIQDEKSKLVTYAMCESLLVDHHTSLGRNSNNRSAEVVEYLQEAMSRRYSGCGTIPVYLLSAIETLISRQILCAYWHSHDASDMNIDVSRLSTPIIRGLYACQLELDAFLHPRVSALCRLWAEDRFHDIRSLAMLHDAASTSRAHHLSHGESNSVEAVPSGEDDVEYDDVDDCVEDNLMDPESEYATPSSSTDECFPSLYVVVLDGQDFLPAFGSHRVQAYCSLELHQWSTEEPFHGGYFTDLSDAKIGRGSEKAYLNWGSLFAFALPDNYSIDSHQSMDMRSGPYCFLECTSRSLFQPSYGGFPVYVSTVAQLSGMDDTDLSYHVDAWKVQQSELFPRSVWSNGKVDDNYRVNNFDSVRPTVRYLSLIGYGNQDFHDQLFKKLKAKSEEAVKNKKMIMERQEALLFQEKINSGLIDPDAPQSFVLDPSVLTIKDFQITFRFPRFSFDYSLFYVVPFNLRYVALQQERDLKEYTLVPVFHLHLDQMQYRGLLSNNPWKGSISANIELLEWSVNSSVMSREESNSFQRLPCISLPNLSAMVKFEQSSTVGKYVDGLLDWTCFDWSARFELPPFSIAIHSQPFSKSSNLDGTTISSGIGASSSSSTSTSPSASFGYVDEDPTKIKSNRSHLFWKAFHYLNHLWMPKVAWSLGNTSFGWEMDSIFARRSSEISMLLDDKYAVFPSHLNVLQEVWNQIVHIPSSSKFDNNTSGISSSRKGHWTLEDVNLLPKQRSIVSFHTLSHSMDLGIDIHTSSEVIEIRDDEPPIMQQMNYSSRSRDADGSSHEKKSDENLSKTSDTDNNPVSFAPDTVSGLFGWMSFGSSKKVETSTVSANPTTSSSSVSSVSSNSNIRMSDDLRDCWVSEKAQLEARIRELEQRNEYLESKLEENNMMTSSHASV